MKIKLLFALLYVATFSSFSQEIVKEDSSMKGQFDKIYRTSTTYKPLGTPKKYKVIDLKKYQELKSNVLDSIKKSKKLISKKEILLQTERNNIQKLNATLSKTKSDLEAALKNENSISLLGLQVSKITYNLTLWVIIILLSLFLAFFIFKFSKSNVLTKEAQENLEAVEQDFESHRKKSLEREQKLRRQLQDEVNKNRNT